MLQVWNMCTRKDLGEGLLSLISSLQLEVAEMSHKTGSGHSFPRSCMVYTCALKKLPYHNSTYIPYGATRSPGAQMPSRIGYGS